ncbi:MAG: hypothetical protein JNG85_08555, partial [Spirochaetaceae bacterium]|nr:hypothetical protein [Spirochaetaceae bacterium]
RYVEDCAAVLSAFSGDPRFSRRAVAGHTEGALVAAAAMRLAGSAARFEGLALLCPSGKGAAASVEEALASAPPEYAAEARAIMDALLRGERYAEPSPYFADFFRPSFQAYLASWFRYDLLAELAAAAGPLLLVQGNRDVQVSLAEFYPLAKARPDAAAVILPGMNHVLKEVPAELDENYRAFSDPGFPLAEGLAGLLAAFARGEAPPEGLPRYDGGVMQERQGEPEPEPEAEAPVPAPGAPGPDLQAAPSGAPQAGIPAP